MPRQTGLFPRCPEFPLTPHPPEYHKKNINNIPNRNPILSPVLKSRKSHNPRRSDRVIIPPRTGRGTIPPALGSGYPKTGSKNNHMIHRDMMRDLNQDSAIRIDETPAHSQGKCRT